MFKKSPKTPEQAPEGPVFSDDDITRARKWFVQGQSLAEKKNWDYAIESYINGLDFWPEAVEEGHKPCRAAALFRGGKKVGFSDTMKYKTNAKEPKKAMLNAEMLLSKDTKNVGYMEVMFRNAAKGRYTATLMWIGEMFADAAAREEKSVPARFELMREVYEELAERIGKTDPKLAITALERAVEAMSRLQTLKPYDMEVSTDVRDLAGKLTILKGRYSSDGDFRDSMQDADSQHALHDQERAVQSDSRMDELIARAKAEYTARPTDPGAIAHYVDLLCRRETDAEETKAMGVLIDAYKAINEYRLKMRADEIRMKQLKRKGRQVVATGDAAAARAHLKEQLRFELGVFKERVRQYPTDLRIRYEYGKRLFQAGQFNPAYYDEAIPTLQEARNDPKTRTQCNLYIGRAFFDKGYFSQAADTFREAIAAHEIPDDEVGKDLHYWLGRAFEADGRVEDTLKIYGQLVQWDYNYRKGEVRKRIDDLRRRGTEPPPAQ